MAGEQVVGPGLIEFGDLLIGRCQEQGVATPYRLRELSGWEETPGVDSGTVLRSGAHGGYPGRLFAQTRTVTAELLIRAGPDGMGTVLADLNAATSPVEDTEQPLVIQTDDRGPLLAYARVLRRSVPVGRAYRVGTVAGAAIQWEATDPRRYGLVEQVSSTELPQPETGLDWGSPETGLDWNEPTGLDWGSTTSTGNTAAVNGGEADAHPVIEFRGPVETPSLTNLDTGDVLEYDLILSVTDVLVVDTWQGTVVLNGGASRLYSATLRSVPEESFVLPPGSSSLAFRNGAGSVDPAATCTVRFRSAHW